MTEDMENELEWYKDFLEIADKKELLDNLPQIKPNLEKIKDYVMMLEIIKGEEERLLNTLNLNEADKARAREILKGMLTLTDKARKAAQNKN